VQKNYQLTTGLLLLGLGLAGTACGNPTGPVVVSGSASFSRPGTAMTNTPGSVMNWQSFAISSNDASRFIQQSSTSAVLNRVTGTSPAQIFGTLQSNGYVSLTNPNGGLLSTNPGGVANPEQLLLEAGDGSISGAKDTLLLAPGKSMTLTDPRSPDVKVQITAPQNRAVNVGELLGTIGNKDISSALTNRTGTRSAGAAVVSENGSINLIFVK